MKRNVIFCRLCGTRLQYRQTPAFKRRAIFKISLRNPVFSDCTKTELRLMEQKLLLKPEDGR